MAKMVKAYSVCVCVLFTFSQLGCAVLLSIDKMTFSEARDQCNDSLPVMPSYDEYTLFEEFLFNNSLEEETFWIGLHRPEGQIGYTWLNGQSLSVFWESGEPSKPSAKKCNFARKQDGYFWKSEDCTSDKLHYICVNYSNTDWDFTLNRVEVNYNTARTNCKVNGMDLAMIKTQDQQTKLTTFLDTRNGEQQIERDIWIGLVGFATDDTEYNKFRWIDGETLPTADWTSSDMTHTDEKCAKYEKHEWKEAACGENNHYICRGSFERTVPIQKELSDYYDLINNQKPASSSTPLIDTGFTRGALCAAECSKSYLCHLYTYHGSTHTCKTYKSAILVSNNDPNLQLRLRRYV